MILKYLKIENFRSYEHAKIEFSDKQNYFFGRNWQGKSSIVDSIGFALFGKTVFPLRVAGALVSQDNLVREGASRGSVELGFEHNDKEYILIRECPNGRVELKENGKILGQNQTTVKEALEENFGLDNKLFLNVFYAEQDDLRKILESNPEDRKVFVEILLGFGDLKDIKMAARHVSGDLSRFQEEITGGNIKTIIDMIEDLKKRVDEKEEKIHNTEQNMKKDNAESLKYKGVSKELIVVQTQTEQLLTEKGKIEETNNQHKTILKGIETGKCPTCHQTIPKDLQIKLIHELKEKITTLQDKIRMINKSYTQANRKWAEASMKNDRATTIFTRLEDFKFQKEEDERELKEFMTALQKYESQYKVFSNKNKSLKIIAKEKDFLEQIQEAIEQFRTNLRKSMVKDLENGANYFISQFSDEDFDAKLNINDDFGFEVILHDKPVPMFNLSGAARDILALSVRYGLYRIAAKEVDFMLLDEPTRHMDAHNTYKLKQAFNEMKNQQMIIITVHDEFSDAEGKKFVIKKNARFASEITEL
ncbi:MAG: AAA family ATPase [Candidatus Parvarchaeum sp.]